MTVARLMRRCVRAPMLHFAAIGLALFVARGIWSSWGEGSGAPPERVPIHITDARIRQMEGEFRNRWGGAPTAAQLRGLVQQATEEEMLYREARVLALDFEDASVRRRLMEKARAVTDRSRASADELVHDAVTLGLDDDPVIRRLLSEKMRLILRQDDGGAPIAESAIIDYLERHRDRFVQPETVTLTQVFLAKSTRGSRLGADAQATLVALGSEPPSPSVARWSDPFPLGQHLTSYTGPQLSGRFGKAFADQVLALPPGRWSPPLVSPYGVHLVWIHEHLAHRFPPIATVRAPIVLALKQERAAQNLARGLARLRSLYALTDADTSSGR